jgi:hypothetical protein
VIPRFFTVQEARSLLPGLEAAFEQIGVLRGEIQLSLDQIQILDALWGERILEPGNPDGDEFRARQARVAGLMGEIEGIVEDRILGLGVRFPQGGLEQGLVDFPTRLDGRTVYLCWQWGEEDIEAWHEVDAGFRGRRPLTEDDVHRMGREEFPS